MVAGVEDIRIFCSSNEPQISQYAVRIGLDGSAMILGFCSFQVCSIGNKCFVQVMQSVDAIHEVAATSLIAICERFDPDLTALHVLPKLKELFDELVFSQETRIASGSLERSSGNIQGSPPDVIYAGRIPLGVEKRSLLVDLEL
ncbi:hypothetical protein RHGRI_007397 [Rhododendron griersonianum]|uniref:Uncharacterized protein n=1 Tax=Rhododendron griersonianum TaxID=479676 RepID=A0AAV6KZN0_9ERIC|nr:hypothetical protein RHGRI_007397 [Rhododendron griersonianum]